MADTETFAARSRIPGIAGAARALHAMRPQQRVVLACLAIIALAAALGATQPARGADARYSGTTSSSSSLGARPCYVRQPLDGPVFHYSFNEPSGATAEDGTGSGNDGTFQGTVTRTLAACSTDRAGAFAHFDGSPNDGGGTTSIVKTPVSMNNPNTFTLETWFRTPTSLGGPMIGFGNTQTDSYPTAYDRILYMRTGQIYFGVFTGSVVTISSSSRYDDNAWHLAQATLSSSGMELYVDGTLVAADPSTTSGSNYTGWWRIGLMRMDYWPADSQQWNGDLDDVAVYATRLTASQLAAHYSAGR